MIDGDAEVRSSSYGNLVLVIPTKLRARTTEIKIKIKIRPASSPQGEPGAESDATVGEAADKKASEDEPGDAKSAPAKGRGPLFITPDQCPHAPKKMVVFRTVSAASGASAASCGASSRSGAFAVG